MRLGQNLVLVDLYAVLGVSPAATHQQIRAAYRRLAVSSHPDLNPQVAAQAERKMIRINVAASVLLDPTRRAEYDRRRALLRRVVRSRSGHHAAGGRHRYPWAAQSASVGVGSDTWAGPPQRAPRRPLTELELSTLLSRLRLWPARGLCAVGRIFSAWSPQTHASFTLASVCLAFALIACARPSSLPMFEQERETARHAASRKAAG
jgi:curved DNA-binding protein CbpA